MTAPADASSELGWMYRSLLCHFPKKPQKAASIHGNLVGNLVILPLSQVFSENNPHPFQYPTMKSGTV
jgi:hypothetical protein